MEFTEIASKDLQVPPFPHYPKRSILSLEMFGMLAHSENKKMRTRSVVGFLIVFKFSQTIYPVVCWTGPLPHPTPDMLPLIISPHLEKKSLILGSHKQLPNAHSVFLHASASNCRADSFSKLELKRTVRLYLKPLIL